LLIFRPVPESWRGQFLKEKATALAFKLVIFVLIPLGMMRVLFKWTWADLGFSLGDIPGQLAAAGLLILLFGGFNLLAGSAAAPIRKGLYSRKQVGFGYLLAFTWNFLETGLVEEFFFRAFLQTQFTLAFSSPLAGICLDSLVFGLAHAPGIYLRSGDKQGPLGEKPTLLNTILYAVIVLSTAGWFTGVLYWRIQSLLAPVLVHAGLDAAAHTPEFIQALKLPK
jgi:membrane protease YdiL (CAAX protease family)